MMYTGDNTTCSNNQCHLSQPSVLHKVHHLGLCYIVELVEDLLQARTSVSLQARGVYWSCNLWLLLSVICLYYATPAPPTPTDVTAQLTSTTSVRVIWQWTSSDTAPNCFNTTTLTYRPDGGGESSLQLSDPAATEAILTDLQCNTSYTITVVATAGEYRKEGVMLLPLEGMLHSWRFVFVIYDQKMPATV